MVFDPSKNFGAAHGDLGVITDILGRTRKPIVNTAYIQAMKPTVVEPKCPPQLQRRKDLLNMLIDETSRLNSAATRTDLCIAEAQKCRGDWCFLKDILTIVMALADFAYFVFAGGWLDCIQKSATKSVLGPCGDWERLVAGAVNEVVGGAVDDIIDEISDDTARAVIQVLKNKAAGGDVTAECSAHINNLADEDAVGNLKKVNDILMSCLRFSNMAASINMMIDMLDEQPDCQAVLNESLVTLTNIGTLAAELNLPEGEVPTVARCIQLIEEVDLQCGIKVLDSKTLLQVTSKFSKMKSQWKPWPKGTIYHFDKKINRYLIALPLTPGSAKIGKGTHIGQIPLELEPKKAIKVTMNKYLAAVGKKPIPWWKSPWPYVGVGGFFASLILYRQLRK